MPLSNSTSQKLPTVESLIEEYKTSRSYVGLASETKRSAEHVFAQLKPIYDFPLLAVAHAKLDKMVDKMGPGTGCVFITRVKSIMNFAKSLGYINSSPADRLKSPKLGEYAPWSEAEFNKFVDECQSPEIRLAVVLGYYTGQRLSDVLKMRWDDISESIHIIQQKTGMELRLPVHPRLKAVLDQSPKIGPYVVSQENGTRYSMQVFREKFRRERVKVGLTDELKFHGLRKSMACRLAEASATTNEIMAVGGWRTSRQVDRYTSGADQERLAKEAMKKL